MKTFKPTYLYIKRHAITGLRYFGKTTGSKSRLLEQYNGSGEYWKAHLRVHGKEHVVTDWYCLFTDKDALVEFAEFFSEEMNIINAKDTEGKKAWANLKQENGLDGGGIIGRSSGKGISRNKGIVQSSEHAAKTAAKKGNCYGEANKGKTPHNKGVLWSEEVKAKMRKPKIKVTCPHCNKLGGANNMYRYHFDKCKNIKEVSHE